MFFIHLHYIEEFVDILNAMRVGEMSDEQIEKLTRLSRPLKYEDGIEPTELCVVPYLTVVAEMKVS